MERTNGQGSAGAGVTTAIWWTKVTTELASGGTITVTLNNAVTAKTCSAWEFTIGSGKTMQVAGSNTAANDGVTDPADLVVSGLSNIEHLFVANDGHERAGISYTKDASNTAFTQATIGSGLGGMMCEGSFRIVTATSDGNDISYGSGVDGMQLYVAFDEVDEASTGQPFAQRHIGIPTARRDRPGGWN
jgi:hypothetical protein